MAVEVASNAHLQRLLVDRWHFDSIPIDQVGVAEGLVRELPRQGTLAPEGDDVADNKVATCCLSQAAAASPRAKRQWLNSSCDESRSRPAL